MMHERGPITSSFVVALPESMTDEEILGTSVKWNGSKCGTVVRVEPVEGRPDLRELYTDGPPPPDMGLPEETIDQMREAIGVRPRGIGFGQARGIGVGWKPGP